MPSFSKPFELTENSVCRTPSYQNSKPIGVTAEATSSWSAARSSVVPVDISSSVAPVEAAKAYVPALINPADLTHSLVAGTSTRLLSIAAPSSFFSMTAGFSTPSLANTPTTSSTTLVSSLVPSGALLAASFPLHPEPANANPIRHNNTNIVRVSLIECLILRIPLASSRPPENEACTALRSDSDTPDKQIM